MVKQKIEELHVLKQKLEQLSGFLEEELRFYFGRNSTTTWFVKFVAFLFTMTWIHIYTVTVTHGKGFIRSGTV